MKLLQTFNMGQNVHPGGHFAPVVGQNGHSE